MSKIKFKMYRRRAKRIVKRRKYGRRTYTRRRTARAIKRIRSVARSTIKRMAETKYAYSRTSLGGQEASGLPVIVQLSGGQITQGAGASNRIGSSIQGRRLTVKGFYDIRKQVAMDTVNYYQRSRIMVGYFTQEPPNNAPIASDFFDPNLIGTDNTFFMNAQPNREYFRPIYDKITMMGTSGGYMSNGYKPRRMINMTMPFKKTISYKTVGTDPLQDSTLFPYMIVFLDVVQSGILTGNLYFDTKLSYIDI